MNPAKIYTDAVRLEKTGQPVSTDEEDEQKISLQKH